MPRVKYSVDYIIKSTPSVLYNFMSTPSGLEQWFADRVEFNKGNITFTWNEYQEQALILEQEEDEMLRLKMENHENEEFVEFRITKAEVTGDTILIITDFAEQSEVEDQKRLWNRQIESLISSVGGRN